MKMRLTLTSLGVITAAALAISTLTASARPATHSLDVSSLVPELANAQEASDDLPDFMQPLMTDIPLQEGSVRLMANSSYGTHWVGVDGDQNICVITLMQDESSAGVNCTPRPAFYANGVSLSVSTSTGPAVVAHLLPPDVGLAAVDEAIASKTNGEATTRTIAGTQADEGSVEVEIFSDSNLVVMSQDASRALGSVHVPRAGQQDLILQNLVQ